MADAPFGARSMLLLLFKNLAVQVGGFSEAVGRLRVVQIVFMAVESARLDVFSLSCVLFGRNQYNPTAEQMQNRQPRARPPAGEGSEPRNWVYGLPSTPPYSTTAEGEVTAVCP